MQGEGVVVNYVKPAEDGQGVIVRLVNLGEKPATARVSFPGRSITKAWLCGTLEDNRRELAVKSGTAVCELAPRCLTAIRVAGE